MEDTFMFIYVTCKNTIEAESIGKAMVTKKHCACANIISGMKSIYIWKDELQEDIETILILKSLSSSMDTLIKEIRAIHSYENPCIIGLEIKKGSEDYLKWIKESLI